MERERESKNIVLINIINIKAIDKSNCRNNKVNIFCVKRNNKPLTGVPVKCTFFLKRIMILFLMEDTH